MNVSSLCYSLFIASDESLYCSLRDLHIVVKNSLNGSTLAPSLVAGVHSINGSTLYLLREPRGIFVDDNLNLYVADSLNNRIQFFSFGAANGTTLAGTGASGTIALNFPNGVVLDGHGHLFITDTNSNRIVCSTPDGYRCLVGCGRVTGAAANQLNKPWMVSFDTYGNMYVSDRDNARIQKFDLATNSCGRCFFIQHRRVASKLSLIESKVLNSLLE